MIAVIFMMLVLILTMAILYSHIIETELGEAGVFHFAVGDVTMSPSSKLFILYTVLAVV